MRYLREIFKVQKKNLNRRDFSTFEIVVTDKESTHTNSKDSPATVQSVQKKKDGKRNNRIWRYGPMDQEVL